MSNTRENMFGKIRRRSRLSRLEILRNRLEESADRREVAESRVQSLRRDGSNSYLETTEQMLAGSEKDVAQRLFFRANEAWQKEQMRLATHNIFERHPWMIIPTIIGGGILILLTEIFVLSTIVPR